MNAFKTDAFSKASIIGVRVDDISRDGILNYIDAIICSHRKAIITYVNVYAMNLAYTTPWFTTFLNGVNLNFCDGVGIKLAARMLGTELKHRNTPPDWIDSLCSLCVDHQYSIFFLGAKPGISNKAAQILVDRHSGLTIAGTYHGFFDHSCDSLENLLVIQQINQVKPNILIVGFGMPLQEKWISENWENIDANIALPVGAMIDYVAGEVVRAPRWMTDHGLEWLGRLIIEPKRLWKRYLIGIPVFFWRVMLQKFGLLKIE